MYLPTRRSTLLLGSSLLMLTLQACAPHDDPNDEPPTMPVITAQPQPVESDGGAVELRVAASGGELSYQWFVEEVEVPGARASTYFSSTTGRHEVRVRNSAGEVRSTPVQVTVADDYARYDRSVARAADELLSRLSAAQKTMATTAGATGTVLFDDKPELQREWSVQPVAHQGLRLADLTDSQRRAADRLIAAALSGQGVNQVFDIQRADDIYSHTSGNAATGAGQYSVAFFGMPGEGASWALQIGGHQLVHNIAFGPDRFSATPMYLGARPPHWVGDSARSADTSNGAGTSGNRRAPLEPQREAVARLAELMKSENAARLTQAVTALRMLRPEDSYPATDRGMRYDSLNADQKAAVKAVIEAWLKTLAPVRAKELRTAYLDKDSPLEQTYVAYSNGRDGTLEFGPYPNAAGRPSRKAGSYLRIDGPRVWIEFLVQSESTSVDDAAKVYYSSLWRDKRADYGAAP